MLGEVIEELNSSGQKQIGYVYTPSGTQFATQVVGQNYVQLKQRSPLNTTQRGVFTTGSASRIEFDPVGATVRTNPNSPLDHSGGSGDIPSGGGGSLDGRFNSMANPLSGCTLDGVFVPCSLAMRGEGTSSDVVYIDPFVSVAYRSRRKKPIWVEVDTSYATWKEVNPGVWDMVIMPGAGGYFEWVGDPDDALELFTQPQNLNPRFDYGQKRADLEGDKDLKPPRVTKEGAKLSACAKAILGQFLDIYLWRQRDPGRLLNTIRLHLGIPDIVKKYAVVSPTAFTYGADIFLKDGLNPKDLDNFDGLVLLAHEYTHSLQADMLGDAAVVFRALYLTKSATAHLSGKDAYTDNAFEVQARQLEGEFRRWLEENYGRKDPCKRLAGGSW